VSVEPPMVTLKHRVCGTRNLAREVIAERPDASPGLAVYLRCDKATAPTAEELREKLPALADHMAEAGVELDDTPGVEVMSGPFIDEILKAWPKAQLVGASKEIQREWEWAVEWRKKHRGASHPDTPGGT
jgi:hypothetical protein